MRKKRNNHSGILAALLLATLAFTGCKKKQEIPPPPPQVTVKAKSPVQKQLSSVKVAGTAEPTLDFTKKKDPFKPFIEPVAPAEKPKLPVAAKTGNLLPIQSYEVNKFTVSGIIVGFKENTALIVDPTGKGYVVKEGMLIGSNDGRISKITPSHLEVVETYRDDTGHNRKRTVMLALKKK